MAMEDGCSYDATNKMKIRQMIGVHSTVGIDLKSINVIPIQKEVKINEMSKIININMTTGMASSELQ
jgi:hypothetical protein